MSDAEILALVIAAALGGVGTGLGIAIMVMLKRVDKNAASHDAIDAYAHWLAVRKRFTSASMTFISTFRALTNSQSQPQSVAVRRAEANQARDAWRKAASELDTAEAAMIAWSQDASTMHTLTKHPRACSRDIRSAIDADLPMVEVLYDKLAAEDRLAAEALRPGTAEPRATGTALRLAMRGLTRTLDSLDDLAARWARR